MNAARIDMAQARQASGAEQGLPRAYGKTPKLGSPMYLKNQNLQNLMIHVRRSQSQHEKFMGDMAFCLSLLAAKWTSSTTAKLKQNADLLQLRILPATFSPELTFYSQTLTSPTQHREPQTINPWPQFKPKPSNGIQASALTRRTLHPDPK